MEIAKVRISKTTGVCIQRNRIPAGLAGATVSVEFADPAWEKLTKTVVFRGNTSRIAEFDGKTAVVPWEVLQTPGSWLYFGIWGHDSETGLQIPLIEVPVGCIESATDIHADTGTDPTLPVWADLKSRIEAQEKESPFGGGSFDPKPYGLPVLYLDGDITEISKENAVSLNYLYGERSGTCTLKWQGNSSLAYPKKNYTIKFDQEFEALEGWGAQKKYCLKADYIDFSHARNVVSAKLWGKIVKSRGSGTIEQIKTLVNGGAVDGFPCMMVINGQCAGIYNFNIPKAEWMFGMGSGTAEAILCAENYDFNQTALVDGTDLEIEYVTDENDTAWVAESLNRLVTAVRNSDGTDIDSTIAQYLDLESAIDYLIFTVMQCGTDNTRKNYILATYDGVKWFFSAYDMDGTWGLHWSGGKFYSAAANPTLSAGSVKGFANKHKLMNLLYTYKFDAIQKRYHELRETILSESGVEELFINYASAIPKALHDAEIRLWPAIPGTATNTVFQIINWYRNRCEAMDADIGEMEYTGTTYSPEIAGFVRMNGTISTSANYKRTDYLSLDGITTAEYVVFAKKDNQMATWALFDANKNWLASSDDEQGTDYYTTAPSGAALVYGLLHRELSIVELLQTYPSAAYIVMSTYNPANLYESFPNQDGKDVGWGSTEQYITLK